MARKKNISKDHLISWYMEFVLEHNHHPKSVFSFAKENNFEEAEFYKFFGSFEALEQSIFGEFFNNTIKMLAKSEEYPNYDPRNKLLSFYFTFFELLTANRSYVVYALHGNENVLKLTSLRLLKDLKKDFKTFANNIGIEKIDLQQEQLVKLQERTTQESSWIQMVLTLKFWLDDTSASFEKTDIFIEKSVNSRFDLLDIKPLKSLLDFGKFILKEKVNFN
jgi:AcrR family transcriptional regulator